MTNESAFPIPLDDRPGSYPAEPGMTLRDYFAAKALTSIIVITASGQHSPRYDMSTDESMAKDAYAVADAMLKERAK